MTGAIHSSCFHIMFSFCGHLSTGKDLSAFCTSHVIQLSAMTVFGSPIRMSTFPEHSQRLPIPPFSFFKQLYTTVLPPESSNGARVTELSQASAIMRLSTRASPSGAAFFARNRLQPLYMSFHSYCICDNYRTST